MTRFFYDTEFLEDGNTIDLISIGIITDDGEKYYAVNSSVDWDRVKRHSWLVRNVVPHLPITGQNCLDTYLAAPENQYPQPSISLVSLNETSTCVKPKQVIANEVRDFIQQRSLRWQDNKLWAWYGAYDHVVLCQLFGPMAGLPNGVPRFTRELMQLWEAAGHPEKPRKPENAHNALADACWNKELWTLCVDILRGDDSASRVALS